MMLCEVLLELSTICTAVTV